MYSKHLICVYQTSLIFRTAVQFVHFSVYCALQKYPKYLLHQGKLVMPISVSSICIIYAHHVFYHHPE